MRVLVTGANGFIGAHVVGALLDAGHAVVGTARDIAVAKRRAPAADWIKADLNRDTTIDAWAPRLDGIDAVVNCAGVLQGGGGQSIEAIHASGPIALFDACAHAGVRRAVQISALGVEADAAAGTEYADTKRAADDHLMGLDLDWIVVRPSLVYAAGSYGGTSLIRGLAGFPFFMPLPGDGEGQAFDPVHARDLAAGIAKLVEPGAPARRLVEAAGPERLTLRDFAAKTRAWLGFAPARVLSVPMGLIRLGGKLGDMGRAITGRGTITSTTVRQMTVGATGDGSDFAEASGVRLRPMTEALSAEPSHVQDRWHARAYFARPLLRITLALFWLATGLVTLLAWPRKDSEEMLTQVGVPDALLPLAFWAGSFLDIILGTLLLIRWRVRLVGAVMIAVTIPYLTILTLGDLRYLWFHPLGPLTKTLPIVAATLLMMAIEDDR